jgi:hypothetical protein
MHQLNVGDIVEIVAYSQDSYLDRIGYKTIPAGYKGKIIQKERHEMAIGGYYYCMDYNQDRMRSWVPRCAIKTTIIPKRKLPDWF